MENYAKLLALHKEIELIGEANAILSWDSEVMMPDGSADNRAEQLATLAVIAHKKGTSKEYKDLLDQADAEKKNLSNTQKANIRELKRNYIHAKCMPSELVSELTKVSKKCEVLWRRSKEQGDYKSLKPIFSNLLKLVREQAQCKAEALKVSRYQALVDQYDPHRNVDEIEKVFNELRVKLPPLVSKIKATQGVKTQLHGKFPIDKQKELGLAYMKKLSFDFNKGRLDISTHPFCGGTPDDVRITTRYREDEFIQSFEGIMHETGHALYEQALPKAHRHEPIGQAAGIAIHESQSLFVEYQICRSELFLKDLHKQMFKYFKLDKSTWTFEQFYKIANWVQPSFIRVEADEITYPLHVILRYELEKAMIEDGLEVDDLPNAWNQKMKQYLGIIPAHMSDGCLQDIHWYGGMFGYFPCYTLGALTAAQLKAKMATELNFDKCLKDQNYLPIIEWLNTNVHSKGCLYSAEELTKNVTGSGLNPKFFLDYAAKKFNV